MLGQTVSVAAAAMATNLPLAAWAKRRDPKPWVPLGKLAAARGIDFGMAVNPHRLADTPSYGELLARECTIVTPENAMKWEALHPARDRYDFQQADAIVDFAAKHNIKVHGHTFVWHRALPPWVAREATDKASAETILREHITAVMQHFKGRVLSWDVVNEAIQPKDGLPGNMRNSFWYEKLGPEYMDIAFDAAHKADPKAVLSYNDYGLEYANRVDTAKRQTVLTMLRELKKRGVPITALGMQSHLRATGEKFGPDLADFIHEVHSMGLECWVTELDVDDSRVIAADDHSRDMQVADVYKQYLDLVLGTGCVNTVVTWGVWDQVRAVGAEAGVATNIGKSQRPLLFDSNGQPKQAAWDAAESFREAPRCKR